MCNQSLLTGALTYATYEVALYANDSCNSPSYDSVLISTACLPISNTGTLM